MKSPNTKDIIITKTLELMRKKHILEITVQDIAKAVGIRKASVFHHFPTAQGTFIRAIEYIMHDEEAKEFLDMLRGQLHNTKKYPMVYNMIKEG